MRKDTYKAIIATSLGVAAGLSACKAVGIAPFSPTPESGANSHEFTPTPESDIYPTHFAWMDGRNEVVQKVMAEYGLSSSDIKGFEITVSGLLSATDVHDEKVQFINFIDPNTGLNVSAYYDSKNPNGLLNDFETINRGGGLFVERQLVDLNDPNNYHTLLIISVDAEEKLKSGESTTIEFNPPEWVRAYMPALDPSKNLVINVPIIPELTTTASLGIIPEFLVIDGSVEGIQTPSPESLLPQEVKEKFEQAGIDLTDMENAQYDKAGLSITLESGEVIVLTNTDLEKGIYLGHDNVLQYRGVFNDSIVYTFDQETGEWGVAISEAESAAIALFDKYGVAPNTYTLAEMDGVMVGTDKETGAEIFRDGRFELGFAVDTIAKNSCESTTFKSTKNGLLLAEYAPAFFEDMEKIMRELNYPRTNGARHTVLLIDRIQQCWGMVYGGKDLLYRNSDKVPRRLSLIAITQEEMEAFQTSR